MGIARDSSEMSIATVNIGVITLPGVGIMVSSVNTFLFGELIDIPYSYIVEGPRTRVV